MVEDLLEDNPSCIRGSTSMSNEFHLVSTFISKSGFDRFRSEVPKLEDLISNILEYLKPTARDKSISPNTNKAHIDVDTTATNNIKTQLERMPADLNYILEKIDLLESSPNCTTIEKLLNGLLDFATVDDFPLAYSTELTQLIRMVTKLKLLVPPKPVDGLEEAKTRSLPLRVEKHEQTVVADIDINTANMQKLLSSYESLTSIQRNCLLYFALIPWLGDDYCIKEKVFIALWYGEGFIDPEHEENVTLLYSNLGGRVCTSKGAENRIKIQEIGEQIFKVLEEKGFISREEDCKVRPEACEFVTTKAKEESFFDFDCKKKGRKGNKLTPHFTGSKRACLLQSQDNVPSSCAVWMNYTDTPKNLQRFKNIRTLLNINDSIVDIKAEWFSKMKNLSVLVLGSFGFKDEDNKDVVDLKFLEELKNMKQLRLFSLRGITAITRLPDSVCELTNLRILNLRDCNNLQELPEGIGSLKNLTHLDLTHCHGLSKFPKGLSLLSKLEVLKGFVITYQVGDQQHTKACTLRHLLKLQNLRKLALVVNRDKFPDNEDLRVFKEMKKLYNLKITWEESYNKNQETKTVIEHGVSNHSRLKMLKCWTKQISEDDAEEPLRSIHLENLEKLVLSCFPSENAPNWLDPSRLPKLEKLYIVGGNLKALYRGTNQHTWNVKTLHLKHLRNLDMDWDELSIIFSSMTRFQKSKDVYIRNFPLNLWDVWSISDEEQ